MGTRQIICADTTEWIKTIDSFDSVITSLPDKEETNMDFETWQKWFVDIVAEIINKTKNYAIFYQTDRKTKGQLLDKSFLLNLGNDKVFGKLCWHKIVLRRGVGSIDLFRPTFTHLLCFSRYKNSGKSIPDVIERGQMVYKNAMGLNACKLACEFIKNNSDTKIIFDPFCGQGSVLAVANKVGFDAVGVEILPEQCKKAELLRFKE